jgi:primosomal protein N' (replication factor Y)
MTLSASVLIDGSGHLQFSYAIPPHLAEAIAVGSRVRVPLRTRNASGTVVELAQSDIEEDKIRPVESLLGPHPVLTPSLLELAQWISRYYVSPLETVLRSVLPEAVRSESLSFKTRKFVTLAKTPTEEERASLERRAPRQAETISLLLEAAAPLPLTDLEAGACRALAKKGWVTIADEAVQRDPHASEEFLPSAPLPLNPDQQAAYDAVSEALDSNPADGPSKPFLLHGVTGSGKTEVYLQLIRKVLDGGGSALVLVPEISLTPQTVDRFKSRFSEIQGSIAVLHSHLSQGERHDEWHKVLLKKARIVIGARSAVFAPLENLGLIVVDEEHENSYKQDTSPRYHGRDIAVVRASLEDCPVLLGTATPSLESYKNTLRGKYTLLELPRRADDKKLPLIRVLDMRQESRKSKGGPAILSEKLRRSIETRLEKNEQCILFLNRRGFATSLVCQECGFVCECNHCSVPLTFHRTEEKLLCHVCGFQRLAPRKCPECSSPSIRFAGYGTEKVEGVLRKVFPSHRIARVDTDTMKRKHALRDTLNAFKTGKVDVLIGTQMIAKGLHFPNVTLVGILNADVGLHMPDFRAGERTFQLLTQVAGRAGRGEVLGEVVVQTFTPHSPSIQFARHHDYAGFAEQELSFRKQFGYPPSTHAVLVTARGQHETRARFSLETLAKRLAADLPEGIVMGEPIPAPLEKAAGQYRFQLLLRAARAPVITRHLSAVLEKLTFPTDVILTVDVDAYQLL